MSDIDNKKSTLNKLGISVLDGNSKDIFLKYRNETVPYKTESFLMYNTNYLITDICKIFNIDNKKDNFLLNLEKKKEYLKKLRINKLWFDEEFYLEKNKIMIKYNFDDFVDMEPDLFIADVKNKFNKLEVKNNFNDDTLHNKELSVSSYDENYDINKMKLNIKNILKERGFITNA